MKIAIVAQRYGTEISGGAELHARYLAERLARHVHVRVLTTCARDYITWRNEFPPGVESINGITVERFPVRRERDLIDFDRRSRLVFGQPHSVQDELGWLESEGPLSPTLLARVGTLAEEMDALIFFSVRYHHAVHGARRAARRAVLVPTAERDPAMGLGVLPPLFRGVRAVMYNSPEERAMIHEVSGNQHVPGVVVGIGSDIPATVAPERARQRFGLTRPFVVYVGRIDANKGCAELFRYFEQYVESRERTPDLVLIGHPVLSIPAHPRIRHLGFVSDQEKFDTIAAADVLIMPSQYESLSMVAIEAWALGRPVLANGRCDVLVGQCIRSNAGLYYSGAAEFAGALDALLTTPGLGAALGEHGRTFYQHHYAWPVIEGKYLQMFERLTSDAPTHGMEPLPGWLARRRRTLPPAAEVVGALTSGPAVAGVAA